MKINKLLRLKRSLMQQREKALPAQLSYKLYQLIRHAEQEEEFYRNSLQKIIDEFAERDQDGKIINDGTAIKIAADRKSDCLSRINDLDNVEITDINIKFTLDELSPIEISIEDMETLQNLITEA